MVQFVQQQTANTTPSDVLQERKRLQGLAKNVGLVTTDDRIQRRQSDAAVEYKNPQEELLNENLAALEQSQDLPDDATPEELVKIMTSPTYSATIDENAELQKEIRKTNKMVPKVAMAAANLGFKGINTLGGLYNVAKATEAVGKEGRPFTTALARIGKTAALAQDSINLQVTKAQKKILLETGSWKDSFNAKQIGNVEPKAGIEGGVTFGTLESVTPSVYIGNRTMPVNQTNILLDTVGAASLNEKGSIIVDPEFFNIMAINAEDAFISAMYATDQEQQSPDILDDMQDAEQQEKSYVIKKAQGLERLGKNIYREYKQTRAAIDQLPTDAYMQEIDNINPGVFTMIGGMAKEFYASANSDIMKRNNPNATKKEPVLYFINEEGARIFEDMYRIYSGLFAAKEVKPQPGATSGGIIGGEGGQITKLMTTRMAKDIGDPDQAFEAMENQNEVKIKNDTQRTKLSTLMFMLAVGNAGTPKSQGDAATNQPLPPEFDYFEDGPNGRNYYADVFKIGSEKFKALQNEKLTLIQNVKDLRAAGEPEAVISAAQAIADNYRPKTILRLEREKAINLQEAILRYDNKENHLTYALQLLTGRMHAQQTLYNPQAHKQVRGVIGGGNVFQYVPGTDSAAELNFKQGIVANLFEDPKVIDPATQQKMGESFKKKAGFRMPKELRLSTFEKEQATKGTGGLWDQYVAWGEELKKLTATFTLAESKSYLTQLKNAKNNSEVAQIKQVLTQRFGNDPMSPRLKAYLAEFEQDGIRQGDYLMALYDYDTVTTKNKTASEPIKFNDTQQWEKDGKTHGPATMGMQFGSVSMAKRSDMIMEVPYAEKIQSGEYKDLRDAMSDTMINSLDRIVNSGSLNNLGSNTAPVLKEILDLSIADRENFLKKSPMTMGYGQDIKSLRSHVQKTVAQNGKIRKLIEDNKLGSKRTIDWLHTMMVDSVFQNMDADAIQTMDTLKSVAWQSVLLNQMITIRQPNGLKAYAGGISYTEDTDKLNWKAPTGTKMREKEIPSSLSNDKITPGTITESGLVAETTYKGTASAQALRKRQGDTYEVGGWTVSRILAELIQAYDGSMAAGVFSNTKYNHNGGPPLETGNWNRIKAVAKANGSTNTFVLQNFDAFIGDSGSIGIVGEVANDIHKKDILNENAAAKVFNWYHTERVAKLKELSEDESTYVMLQGGTYYSGDDAQFMKIAEMFSGERYVPKGKGKAPYKSLTKWLKKNIQMPWERVNSKESLAEWDKRKFNASWKMATSIQEDLKETLEAMNKDNILTGIQIHQIIQTINRYLNLDAAVALAEKNINKGKQTIAKMMPGATNNIDF